MTHPKAWLAALVGRWRAIVTRGAVEREFSEEIRFHIEMEEAQNIARGMSPADARRAAVIAFGGAERMREEHRDARGTRLWEDAVADVRYAARWLARSPGFSASAILTLALGIGGTTAVFSVVDGVLLKPLPYANPEQLVAVWSMNAEAGPDPFTSSPPDFRELRDRATTFEGLAAYYSTAVNVIVGGEPVRVSAVRASPSLFSVLGTRPEIGRVFHPSEDVYGNDRVVVLSHRAWTTRFSARPDVVGSTMTIGDQPHVITGVMPASFRFPNRDAELWLPMSFAPNSSSNTRGNYFLFLVGRMRAGVGIDRAEADLSAIAHRIAQTVPVASIRAARVVPLHEQTVGDSRRGLFLLLAATGALLAIACANVSGLLLARAAARRRELAVRASLGAPRSRLVRQLITEGLLLSLGGAVTGTLLAIAGVRLLITTHARGMPRIDEVTVDLRSLALTAVVSVLATIVVGLWPAIRLTRGDLNIALGDNSRSSATVQHRTVRRALVAAQVALALVLLVGAGLLLRSFVVMTRVDPGFGTTNVLTASLPMSDTKYPEAVQHRQFVDALLANLQSNPQTADAAITSALSLRGGQWGKLVTFADRPLPTSRDQVPAVNYRLVSHGYFKTLGIRVKSGRAFEATDGADAPGVAIVNETMARKHWPNASPIGKTIWMGPPEQFVAGLLPAGFRFPRLTVVGVAADEYFDGLDTPVQPEVYQVYSQSTEDPSAWYLAVRSSANPTALVGAVRGALANVDRAMPLAQVATTSQLVRESSAQRRFGALLVVTFALLALSLAVVGVYGVAAEFVAQRTRELGIRLALGAGDGRVVRLVVGEGMAAAGIGAVVGVGVALTASGVMRNVLFGIAPTDQWTYVAVTSILMVAILLATLIPARHASRIPPALVLRGD